MTQASPRRGRPRVGDPTTMSTIGLGLISKHGWTATTMDQIARTCGVSAPTLFRYFPTKAALLWHGMDSNERLFRAAFVERRPDQPTVDAVVDAYMKMLTRAEHLELLKSRMAVIVNDADASQATWSTHEHWRGLVIELVAEHRGIAADSLEARVIGATIWSLLWAAITTWATAEEGDPSAFIVAAQAVVALGTA